MRGLGNFNKRKEVFSFFRHKSDILCLQEVHVMKEGQNIFQNQWGGEAIWSIGTASGRGVGILLRKNFRGIVKQIEKDTFGRYIILQLDLDGQLIVICNLYAPNSDCPDFFINLFKRVFEYEGKKVIVEDYNTTLSNMIDREPARLENNRAGDTINELMNQYSICDVWRDRNPNEKLYTWQRTHPATQKSRIDYFLCEIVISSWFKSIKHRAGYKSDHMYIQGEIIIPNSQRGNGIWRLNTTILAQPEYVQRIKCAIERAKNQMQQYDSQSKWELIKLVSAQESQEYCREKASRDRLIVAQLEDYITWAQQNEAQLNEHELLLAEKSRQDLERIMEKKTQGAIFRSRCRWYNEGEKNTKYFLNLEKSRSGAKAMTTVITETGTYNDQKTIIEELKNFYETLYTSDRDIKFTYENTNENVKLTPDEKELLNLQITKADLKEAIQGLKKGKCPGDDGLPVEFYLVFWEELKDCLYEAIMQAYDQRELHFTALSGLISLIPKKKKDNRYIKNMRPITLLNVDYKLIEKVLANKIKLLLKRLIHRNQTGFLADRHISTNIKKVMEVMEYADRLQEPGVILSVDYEKCFDRIEIESLIGALRYFDFPEVYVNWTYTLFTKPTARVTNNGHMSDRFEVQRGIKQGGPNSAYYFLLIAEILAISIRNNDHIEGFPINEIKDILGQFADDTDMYLKGNEQTINNVINTLSNYEKNTGFKVSYEKTTLYRIGSLKHSNARFYTERNLNWSDGDLSILGVTITHDADRLMTANYQDLLVKSESILNAWKGRQLSLFAKVIVINTLVASLYVYKMSVLPLLSEKLISKFNGIIQKFLWNGRKPKISLAKLQNSKKFGGANLVNIELKDQSLKVAWVKNIQENEYICEFVYQALCPNYP